MHPDDTCPDGAACIPLRRRDGSIRAYTIVDAADAEWANQWRWRWNGGYAARNGEKIAPKRFSVISLHRELLGLPRKRQSGDTREGDHINRDRLDNRRANLRVLTRDEQAQNKSSRKMSSSQYRGVSWNTSARKWKAYIRVDGRLRNLGHFTDEHEAGRIARAARLEAMPYATD
jgi:hypothetical protein